MGCVDEPSLEILFRIECDGEGQMKGLLGFEVQKNRGLIFISEASSFVVGCAKYDWANDVLS